MEEKRKGMRVFGQHALFYFDTVLTPATERQKNSPPALLCSMIIRDIAEGSAPHVRAPLYAKYELVKTYLLSNWFFDLIKLILPLILENRICATRPQTFIAWNRIFIQRQEFYTGYLSKNIFDGSLKYATVQRLLILLTG
jgi:hypothetical protein